MRIEIIFHFHFEFGVIVSIFDAKNIFNFLPGLMIQTIQNKIAVLSHTELVLFFAFFILYLLRFFYLLLFNGRIVFRKAALIIETHESLSLILTVRNEEQNLKNNLPKILSIKDVDFEVIVVDDYSQDNSFMILGMLQQRSDRLKISSLNQETRFSVKLAQNLALKAAKNNWVLVVPVSIENANATWLKSITPELHNKRNVVIGYSGFNNDGSLVNHLYRVEQFQMFLKSSGFILNGFPYVYSEENVVFRLKKYFEMGGYGQKVKEHFVNLELLINSFIRRNTTTILFQPETVIRKSQELCWVDYFELLKKNFRVEKHLSHSKRLFVEFENFTRLLFLPVTVVVIILFQEFLIIFAGLLFIKFIAHLLIIKIAQNRLNERKIFISSLFYDLIIPYFKFFFRWYVNRKSRKNKWKNK